jgi:predicted nucleic acid-binding Zn ribbon protein
MTTYVYETIPSKAGEKPKLYEIQQSMKDAALTKHPETGEPIRRVVLGGYGLMKQDAPKDRPDSCGPGCGCC